jgi:hypothetical protein
MSSDFEKQLVALQKAHQQLRRVTMCLGVCLVLAFLMGAAAGKVVDGDLSVAGQLKCNQLETTDAATFGGDVTLKKKLSIAGTLELADIKDIHKHIMDQDKRITALTKTVASLRKEIYTDMGKIVENGTGLERELHREAHLHFEYARKKGYIAGVPNGQVLQRNVGIIYLMPQELKDKAAKIEKE